MRYLFIIIFLCSCSYEVSNPVMPLRDYTVNTGKTYYIKGDASVEDIINVINKNWHSRRQYKVIPLEGGYCLLTNIANAITHFNWVDLDLKNMSITNLPARIFQGKNIRSITLSDKLKFIKEYALSDIKQLDTIRLPILCQIDNYAFQNDTSIQTLILNVENYIEEQTNENGKITNYYTNTNHIQDYAFTNTSIVNLIIESTNAISNNAFAGAHIVNLQYNGTNNIFNGMNIECDNLYLLKVTNLQLQPTWNNLKKIWRNEIYINKSL